jgi:hypothetical protein
MKFWTDHQKTENHEENETILRLWSIISSPSPFPASVVLGEEEEVETETSRHRH